jgi:hypothetical protein
VLFLRFDPGAQILPLQPLHACTPGFGLGPGSTKRLRSIGRELYLVLLCYLVRIGCCVVGEDGMGWDGTDTDNLKADRRRR